MAPRFDVCDLIYVLSGTQRAAVTGAVTGAGQLALIPASVRVKDNYSLYGTATTRGPDLDSIQAKISPRRRILLDYFVFLRSERG